MAAFPVWLGVGTGLSQSNQKRLIREGAPNIQGKNRRAHWQYIYAAKGEREVSWFQDDAQPSLALIEEVGSPSSALIDIGGGGSRLRTYCPTGASWTKRYWIYHWPRWPQPKAG